MHVKLVGLIALHASAVLSAVVGGVGLIIAKPTKNIQRLQAFWLIFVGYVSAVNALRNLREGSGAHCIWTQKENEIRYELGHQTYTEPFIQHYSGISLKLQQIIGGLLFGLVLFRFFKGR